MNEPTCRKSELSLRSMKIASNLQRRNKNKILFQLTVNKRTTMTRLNCSKIAAACRKSKLISHSCLERTLISVARLSLTN